MTHNIPQTPRREILPQTPFGAENPFFIIAGPCVIEDRQTLDTVARAVVELRDELSIPAFFKASFDKANRSSIDSYRGPGMEEGLAALRQIKETHGLPLVTDIHTPGEAMKAAEVVDIIQIPAFLCRQTDLILEAAKTGRWVNIKKGQFVAPEDALHIVEKFRAGGSDKVTLCERGYTFGYNNLVVDMRSLEILRKEGIHTVIDVTHSTQLPGGGKQTGGIREMAFPIGRAAAAVGIDGVFLEVHPDPLNAKSDSTTQLSIEQFKALVRSMFAIDRVVKAQN